MVAALALVVACAEPDGVAVRSGVPFAERAGVSLLADVYRTAGEGPRPGLMLIHGGGWESGSRADIAWLAGLLARDGFVVFAIDYRLAPADPFPAALEDARAAVRWVRDHAADYDVDPSRIGAFGVSAGGHLAALLAVDAVDSDSRVSAAVTWSGPMDLALTIAQASPDGRAPLERIIGQFVGCGLDCHDALTAASPLAHVDGNDAPLLIANSEGEWTPLGQARVMARALAGAGVPYRLVEVPGGLHADQFATEIVPGSDDTVLAASLAFLRAELGEGAAAGSESWTRWSSPLVAALIGLILLGSVPAVVLIRRQPRSPATGADGALIALIDDLGRQGLPQRAIGTRFTCRGSNT